jgi:hypothetical protein
MYAIRVYDDPLKTDAELATDMRLCGVRRERAIHIVWALRFIGVAPFKTVITIDEAEKLTERLKLRGCESSIRWVDPDVWAKG